MKYRSEKPTPLEPAVQAVVDAMNTLTQEQRLEVVAGFCHGCGTHDSTCRCWDDS